MIREDHRGRRLQDRAREVHRGRSPRSSSATRRASPCSSARRASRRATRSRSSSRRRRSRTPSSTPSTTRSEAFVVAQAGRKGRDHRQHEHGRPRDRHRPRRQPGDDREARVPRARPRSRTRSPRRSPRSSRSTTRPCKAEGDEVRALGGLHILGHRAPRVAAHRQPAARPRRPAGRPGLEPVLPVARRRPDAHLRGRPREVAHGAHGDAGQRAHRAPVGEQEHPGRAAQGRGAQLRHPQAPARVRRRDERAAQDGLQAAPAAAARHLQARDDRRGRQAHGQDARHQDRPAHRRRGEARRARHGRAPRHADRVRTATRREPPPKTVEEVEEIYSMASLQQDIYQFWGYRFDFKDGDGKRPKAVYERLLEEIPQSLTEQREQLLDLVDSIVGAIVEECCPANKPPGGLGLEGHQGRLRRALRRQAAGGRAPARPRADREAALRGGREEARREGEGHGHGALAPRLPSLLPRGDRPAVGRAPHGHGAPARRHRPARLRPARPEAGVQEGGLRRLHRHDGGDEQQRLLEALQGPGEAREGDRAHRARGRREARGAAPGDADAPRLRARGRRGGGAGRRVRRRARSPSASRRRLPSAARGRRSAETISARAAAVKNSRSATARRSTTRAATTSTRRVGGALGTGFSARSWW